MRRFRIPTHSFLLGALALTPLAAFAQESLFGPIIPQTGACTCPGSAPSWGCVVQVLQAIINIGIALAIVVIVLLIAYAGFRLMTAGANPGARTQAKSLLLNAIVGLVIVLCAWLAVDFVMKAVYNPAATFGGEQPLGPWHSILAPSSDSMCLAVNEHPTPITSGIIDVITGKPITPLPVGSSGVLCPEGNPGCSVSALMAEGLNENQARAMSCIAMTESTGNPNAVNPSSLACGLFQITNKTANGNWRQPQYHRSPCSVQTSCTNARCNMQTAVIMFRESGYRPWTCAGCNNKAQACVSRYDPGAR